MRYTRPLSNIKVTFYPHGALRTPDDDAGGIEKTANKERVTVTASFSDLVPRNLSEIHETDPLRFDDANRETSEGFSPLELSDYCTSVNFSHSVAGNYGAAALTLELPFADTLKLLGGVVAGKAKHLRSDNDALTLRNLCSGGWVVIRQSIASGEYIGRFFGQVSRVDHSLQYLVNGAPLRVVNISVDNFYTGYLRNQIKQTMSRDDSIRELEPSAVFKAADYSQGFLKSIKDSFKGEVPATVLAQVVRALGGHKLPASLAGFANLPVGFYVKVCDGSFDEMNKYGLKGADVDVIKGKIMTLFQGAFSNNMTHHEVITQMFNAAPQLFEYFPLFVPLTSRELTQVSKSRVFKRLGGVPVIIYRYKPFYPYAPPSLEGIKRLTRFKYGVSSKAQSKTDCEKFFGEMRVSEIGKGQSYEINNRFITALSHEVNEDQRINFTFVEGAFSNAQGHSLNYFRTYASPALNKTDINRHGLRSFSMHTPFVSLDSDPEAVKNFNQQAPNALAERLFHNLALGHTFSSGNFTVQHDEAATHLINARASLACVPVGSWASFKLDISEADQVTFTCYIEAVSTTITADTSGIITSSSVYRFTRGHIGIHAPEFDIDKYTSEELTLLVKNDEVSDT